MDILTSKKNGILTIEFNRPKKKNSITAAMYQMIADALQDGQSDPDVRVIMFCGKQDIGQQRFGEVIDEEIEHAGRGCAQRIGHRQIGGEIS